MNIKRLCPWICAACILLSCNTVHFDQTAETGAEETQEGVTTHEEELEAEKQALRQYEIEEDLKQADVEQTVIYIDRPVYSPVEPAPPELKGAEAVNKSMDNALQIPMKFVNGVMYYPFDDTFVYEIHCQPYRTTDLVLEPGEQVLEMPFLSEEKVWEIGAGVSRKNGQDTQHFFLKPAVHSLTTSMIVITDRRVYHLLLKSFRDRYMVMVEFIYPPAMPFTVKTDRMNERRAALNSFRQDTDLVSPEFLSFDYKMTYSIFKKPLWLPKRVYDDGRKTYIVLDERMLHAESPVLFNHRNRRINYRVHKNLMVIDELIEKVTLRRGKEKITIIKKNYRTPYAEGEPNENTTP